MGVIAHWKTTVEHAMMALEAEEYGEAWSALKSLGREMEEAEAAPSATTQGAVAENKRLRRKLETIERTRSADEDRYEAEIARLRGAIE